KSRARSPAKAREAAERAPKTRPAPSLPPELMAKLHLVLRSAAKTPDQQADAAVVALAKQEAEKGNPAVAESLLGKVGSWAQEYVPKVAEQIAHGVGHRLLKRLFGLG